FHKNKKLVINIASTKKDLLSSRFEANHQDLGSSIKDDKKRFVLNMMKRLIMVPMIILVILGLIECGRILTEKEAFKKLCHGFHGKKPGKRKQEKRMRKHEDSSKKYIGVFR
ncbi:unnamed protein product, partial [Brassica oleracea]